MDDLEILNPEKGQLVLMIRPVGYETTSVIDMFGEFIPFEDTIMLQKFWMPDRSQGLGPGMFYCTASRSNFGLACPRVVDNYEKIPIFANKIVVTDRDNLDPIIQALEAEKEFQWVGNFYRNL